MNKVHICFPMIVGGSAGGVVQFLFDPKHIGPDRKDTRMFKAEQYIKESLSVIEAKRLTNTLRESALSDPLTGLYNRRFLQEYTETLVSGVLRRKKTIGLIMCDLDYFKQVNDAYGHNIGDALLKETASAIKKCVRVSDLVIRFGGEEFLVLMLDINEGETMGIAEKIRETIKETKIKVPDGSLSKTISLGISEFPLDTDSFWQAIKFADVALYKAKDTGRNKSVRFTTDMWTAEQF
ncbi:MAG: GGDEF domain-containing protein [Nitrospirae bacterium]|nr:GGDEF domain-containing protein [Nitrospirota bacterium]